MRKFFTLILIVVALSANATLKVGYYTYQKTMVDGATTVSADPIITMLQSDANITLTVNVITDATATATVDFSGYDVIVIQESFSGSAGILTPSGALGLAKLTKPTLFNKCYAFKSGRAISDGSSAGGGDTQGIYNITVDATNQSHDIFKGITFTNNEVQLFVTGTADDGTVGGTYTKAINYVTGLSVSGGTLLGIPTGVSSITLCISDFPKGTTLGDQTLAARMITFGMNFGAISASNGSNITSACLTMWKNAIYSLGGISSKIDQQTLSGFSIARSGSQLSINFGKSQAASVAVYSITGKLISKQNVNSTSATVNMSGQPKGVYIVNVNGKAQKFALQ